MTNNIRIDRVSFTACLCFNFFSCFNIHHSRAIVFYCSHILSFIWNRVPSIWLWTEILFWQSVSCSRKKWLLLNMIQIHWTVAYDSLCDHKLSNVYNFSLASEFVALFFKSKYLLRFKCYLHYRYKLVSNFISTGIIRILLAPSVLRSI